MFAAAEWGIDVPQQNADFPVVHKMKRTSNKSNIIVSLDSTCTLDTKIKKKKKLHQPVTNSQFANIRTNQKNVQPKNKAVKLTHSSSNDQPIVNSADDKIAESPKKKCKAKKRKGTKDKDIDEKEMVKVMKPNDDEHMLFGNNNSDKYDRNKQKFKNLLEKYQKPIVNSADDKITESPKNKCKANKQKGTMDIDIDEAIIDNMKKEMFKVMKPNEVEEMLFGNNNIDKIDRKKLKFNNLLEKSHRPPIKSNGALLRKRMTEKLKAAQFRYLNEKLYLSEGKDAKELFKSDPNSFKIYHDGFRQQIKKWPINPLEIIIKQIAKMSKETKVADMGCGEGELSRRVPQKVRSFDLVANAQGVEECDMAHTPLLAGEMDVAVYCLTLMGTNLKEYLIEANRVLKIGGTLKIAEVESRFKDVNNFIKCVECYGFKLSQVDDSRKVFYFFDYRKLRDLGSKRGKLPRITLEPCLYKKR